MHKHSLDLMTEFCRTYLESRREERIVILDVGSMDVNGSYRALFASPQWKYIGADLSLGRNVDLVLENAYHWHELSSDSIDVVISGQTFEHTEFFWDTMNEISRVLKPRGLCCIVAPSAGPEHRYPQDCWRIYPDGFAAVARYAYLEVLDVQTQWGDLPEYDNENNKWHDSRLIARKPPATIWTSLRRSAYRWINRKLKPAIAPAETLIQVFPTLDNTHCEEGSIVTRISPGQWKEVTVDLPHKLAGSLRIDFMSELTLIDIASVRLIGGNGESYYDAVNSVGWSQINVLGDAERVPHPKFLRINVTGIDPQLFLPAVLVDTQESPLRLQMRLMAHVVKQRPAFAAIGKSQA